MGKLATIDLALDEMLVNLAAIVLRLSKPDVTRTPEARRALAQSVHQYAACAARSTDPRVQELKTQLEKTLKPSLRIVAIDGEGVVVRGGGHASAFALRATADKSLFPLYDSLLVR